MEIDVISLILQPEIPTQRLKSTRDVLKRWRRKCRILAMSTSKSITVLRFRELRLPCKYFVSSWSNNGAVQGPEKPNCIFATPPAYPVHRRGGVSAMKMYMSLSRIIYLLILVCHAQREGEKKRCSAIFRQNQVFNALEGSEWVHCLCESVGGAK